MAAIGGCAPPREDLAVNGKALCEVYPPYLPPILLLHRVSPVLALPCRKRVAFISYQFILGAARFPDEKEAMALIGALIDS